MQKATYILCVMAVVTSCKKELPPLPSAGSQGSFCWEQFVNDSFDPTSEWFADTSNFGPCPISPNERQLNPMLSGIQFARNNPNVIYFIERKCPNDDYPCGGGYIYDLVKYDICTSQKIVVYSDFEGNNYLDLYVGDEGQILHKTKFFAIPGDNQYKFSFTYTNNDFTTAIEDTAFYLSQGQLKSSLLSQVDVSVYNQTDIFTGNDYVIKYDILQNSLDTIQELNGNYIHQIIDNDIWVIRDYLYQSQPVSYSLYDVQSNQLSNIPGLQNISQDFVNSLIYTQNKSFINAFDDLQSIDNQSGSTQIIFDAQSNNVSIREFSVSPEEGYIALVVQHSHWISNCIRDFKYYLLIYNLQTGEWKALDI